MGNFKVRIVLSFFHVDSLLKRVHFEHFELDLNRDSGPSRVKVNRKEFWEQTAII